MLTFLKSVILAFFISFMSFKKVILEDIKLIKKANITLFKKVNITEKDTAVSKWLEFDKNDLEQNVKIYKA
jgi:hypothetical protein